MVNLSTANPMEEKAGKRILCIEDEPEMIDLIRLILIRRGFEVAPQAEWRGSKRYASNCLIWYCWT